MFEFSKFMILLDYLIEVVLLIATYFNSEMAAVVIAWSGQLAISTGFYYWKSRMENRVKLPILLLKSLPKELRDELDMTDIIKSIIGGE